MKIQINSLAALERLIGGDSDIEIDIRNSVVQAFSKKHLKNIALKLTQDGLDASVKSFLIHQNFIATKPYNSEIILGDKGKALLDEHFKASIEVKIKNKVETAISNSEAWKNMQKHLDMASNAIIDGLTDANLKQRLDAMVDEKIKQRLGL